MTRIEWLKAKGYKRNKEFKDVYEKKFKDCMLTFCINEHNSYCYLKLENEPLSELDRKFWKYLGTKFDLMESEVKQMLKESEDV